MFQNSVAMCPRHGENKISICRNSRRELSCGEVGYFTTQLFQDERRVGVNRMRDHRTGTSAGCLEFRNFISTGIGRRESLRNW
jgi:hypothetical protein